MNDVKESKGGKRTPYLHDRVLRDLNVGDVLEGPAEEVAEDAPQHGLVGDDDEVVVLLHLQDDRGQPADAVHVRLACIEVRI